jgi:hypothetical protein
MALCFSGAYRFPFLLCTQWIFVRLTVFRSSDRAIDDK